MKIVFIASGNGYGHLRRVCEVVKHIYEENPHVEVWILGASAHHLMIQQWGFSAQLKKFKFAFLNVHLERHLLALMPSAYTFERYQDSLHEVLEQIRIIAPEIIVSDNLVGIVHHYPRTLLMGSFLFSDTLAQRFPESEEIMRICEYEKNILDKHTPVMLGVEEMVMPFVCLNTRFKGLPWFCTRESHTSSVTRAKKNILLTGGGTSFATSKLMLLSRELHAQGSYHVFLDSSLYSQMENAEQKKFILFDFSHSYFNSLDWIVCRPGIGILTEAVRYGVPVCALDEEDPEISHNARRVEELEIGIRLGLNELIPSLDKNTELIKKKLAQRNTGGALEAARYILTC